MKKFFLSAIILVGVACCLYAQQDSTKQAAGVPPPIQSSFQASYPGVTAPSWQQMNDWWYASYTESNRITDVYYNAQPYYLNRNESFKVMLPVLNSQVPEDVITTAIHTYTNDLYSITAIRIADSTNTMQSENSTDVNQSTPSSNVSPSNSGEATQAAGSDDTNKAINPTNSTKAINPTNVAYLATLIKNGTAQTVMLNRGRVAYNKSF